MEINKETSGILSEIKRLGNNTLYPAAFVVAGSIVKQKYQIDNAPAVLSNWAQSAWNSLTIENAKSFANQTVDLAKSGWTKISLEGSVKSIANKYKVEIGTVVAIGATATLIDFILKKTPIINRFGFIRVPVSIGLASTAVYAGANYVLKQKIDPEMLLDIAIKVGIVGIIWKATTQITAVGLRTLGARSASACEKLSFGEWPSNAKVTVKTDERDVQQKQPVEETKNTEPVAEQNDGDTLNVSADDPNLVYDNDGNAYYLCPNQEEDLPDDYVEFNGKYYMPVGDSTVEQGEESREMTPQKQQVAKEYNVNTRGRTAQGTPQTEK